MSRAEQIEARPPHVTYSLTGGASEYDWTVQANGLTFEEALTFTEVLGVFIRARKQLQREAALAPKAAPLPETQAKTGGSRD